jgi:hypothetical protein
MGNSIASSGKTSTRVQGLRDDAAELHGAAVTAGTVATQALGAAVDHTSTAALASEGMILHGTEAALDVVGAAAYSVLGTINTFAGITVRMAEEVGDLLGAALQHLGRALIGIGNWLRGRSHPQIVLEAVAGKSGPSLSDRLMETAGDHFEAARNQMVQSLHDFQLTGHDAVIAAKSLAGAAGQLAIAAAAGGSSALLEVTAAAVSATAVAVDASERGVDLSGALLQQAGIAVVHAGNALANARGTHTVISADKPNS